MQKDIIVVFFNDWSGIIDECRYRYISTVCYVNDGRCKKALIQDDCEKDTVITYEYKIETTNFTYLFLKIDDAICYLFENENHIHITNLDKHLLRLLALKQVAINKELVGHISLVTQLRNCMLIVIGILITLCIAFPFLMR